MQNINLGWNFKKLPEMDINTMTAVAGIGEDGLESVDLPHTWYRDGAGYQGTVLYKKSVRIEGDSNKRVFLHFGAADRFCKVFVNGQYIGEHKGGYSAFGFDITNQCNWMADNEIAVLLDNRSFNQISPLAGDFTVFGGLYRDVTLCITEKSCFDRTFYGTNGVIVKATVADDTGKVIVENHTIDCENAQIAYTVRNAAGEVVLEQTESLQSKVELIVPHPELWRGKKAPVMYTLHAALLVDGKKTDETEVRFGFKTVSVDAQQGFFLNSEHMKIQGVAKHQDFGGVFCATTEEHLQQDLHDILEIGANSVRLSHYQHPQRMYDLCDEAGLVVWAEIPMLKFLDDEALFENACSQMKELIYQNMHHPSICFWGIQNEIAMFGESEPMYDRMQELGELVKRMDDTRVSACANLFCVKNDSKLNTHTQAVGYNIYFGWYYGNMVDNADFVDKFHQDNPHIPLGITEYGVDCNLAYHAYEPKVRDYSEEFQALYHETVYPIFRQREYIWGTYVWNMFDFSSEIRDEGGVRYRNCKGLVTYDRKIKKDAFYYYKAQWSDEPFVKIAESRFVNRERKQITVKVYSNQTRVRITVNGASYTADSNTGVFRFENVALHPGENQIVASAGALTDQVTFTGVAEKDESYIYVDQNPGINVKNWFIDAVEEEKMFPTGMFSIRDACNTIVECDQAIQVVAEFSEKLAEQMKERRGMMPLERILNYMKNEFSEDDCKRLNAALTKIKKQ